MRSRIRDFWSEIRRVHGSVARVVGRADGYGSANASDARRKGKGSMVVTSSEALGYVDSSTSALWKALEGLLLVIVRDVGVDADMFGEILGMLMPLSRLPEDAVRTLEADNADQVWLGRWKQSPVPLQRPNTGPELSWAFADVTA